MVRKVRCEWGTSGNIQLLPVIAVVNYAGDDEYGVELLWLNLAFGIYFRKKSTEV